ncbi:MAG: glycine betaine ABC transporter substrate-binding protein [Gammaproteobacteria bacterium]|nr:glycine betaine ABC transporter substrate-binding protein [Gammaproteobacteria bacterium]
MDKHVYTKEDYMHLYKKFGALIALSVLSSPVLAADCGSVSISEMNWASAELMANVDKFILEEGYDCDVSLVPGATQTTFASMNEKGQPDVAPELWTNSVAIPLKQAMDEGRLHTVNAGPITDLGEGWWISPKTAKDHPELKTVLDIIKRPDIFPDKEDPSKGAFVTCPSGWACQLVNANLFRAFDMEDKGWKLVDPGSAAGLDGSMSKAVERDEYWFGYYWSPTAMIGKYNMVKVPYGVPFVGREHWDNCLAKAEQDCANPKPSAWTQSEVRTVITDKLKKNGGKEVTDYFENRVFPGAVMNQMLVYMDTNQASGEDAAIEFLLTQGDVWQQWVPSAVASKVNKALN